MSPAVAIKTDLDTPMTKTAVVLFNLGGPDSLNAVRPFLFNLFNDNAIIRVPRIPRWCIAQLIAWRRNPTTKAIYAQIGGRSPIRDETDKQAKALELAVADVGEVRVFIAMRYWHPRANETAAAVKAFDPERVILLPLYPQFSTTTTASSFREWGAAAARIGMSIPTRGICCFPENSGWVRAQAKLLPDRTSGDVGAAPGRVLFSAHGLPEKIVAEGDPYQWQVERSAEAIAAAAGLRREDWRICYQSRAGPLKWIGPSLDEALGDAADDGVGVIVLPIAFVSEHSETLVELDIKYRERARQLGVRNYMRVSTVGVMPDFIGGLAELIRRAMHQDPELESGASGRICPIEHPGCICTAPLNSLGASQHVD